MASRRRFVYMATRPDTHCGFSVRANTPEEAFRRAMRHSIMKGAVEVEVRSFVGGPVGRWTFRIEG